MGHENECTGKLISCRSESVVLKHDKKSALSHLSLTVHSTWKSVNTLLGEDKTSAKADFTAQAYLNYIEKKVDGIREATASSAPPELTNCVHFNLTTFEIVCVDDVRLHIAAAPSKHCALDPGPKWLIKKCGDVLAPFITDIFNGSITTGHFSIA